MRSLHLFCGVGGDALGFQQAGFEVVGVERDPHTADNARRLLGCPVHELDLGQCDPAQLADTTPPPDVVFLSPPCQGNSGCLPARMATTEKYRALNSLASRTVFLVMEAAHHWGRSPLILIENVARITSRSPDIVAEIKLTLQAYGYLWHASTHNCGQIGAGLVPQNRKRWLLIGRHPKMCPAFVYEPPKSDVPGVWSALRRLPLPDASSTDPLHQLQGVSPMTHLRLALIPPGGDWRAIPDRVRIYSSGPVREVEPRLSGERHNGPFGVEHPASPAHTQIAVGRAGNHWSSLADPRVQDRRAGVYGVLGDTTPAHTVIGASDIQTTHFTTLADPRLHCAPRSGAYGVVGPEPSPTVLASQCHDNSVATVADPRLAHIPRDSSLGVQAGDKPSPTVIGEAAVDKGNNVSDPRMGIPSLSTQPHDTCDANGRSWHATHALAVDDDGVVCLLPLDPKSPPIDLEARRCPPGVVIRALDGTFHRPLTERELLAIQGFPTEVQGRPLVLDGTREAIRKMIGNAVPPPTARAIARQLQCALTRGPAQPTLSGQTLWVSSISEPDACPSEDNDDVHAPMETSHA